MPKHQKSAMTLGLEKILNNPQTSPLTNPQVFRQIMTSANQPITASLKHIGKGAKPKGPSDEERSKARLEKLEESSEK
jgi:hypothetical protein